MKLLAKVARFLGKLALFFALMTAIPSLLWCLVEASKPEARAFVNSSYGTIWLLALLVLWILSTKRKKLVLFLRHFGDQTVNRKISSALYGSMRRSSRLLVLDDHDFDPIPLPPAERISVGLAGSTLVALIVGLLIIGTSVTIPVETEALGFSSKTTGFITVFVPSKSDRIEMYQLSGLANISRGITMGGQYHQNSASDFSIIKLPTAIFEDSFGSEGVPMAFSLTAGAALWLPILLLSYLLYRIALKNWESRRAVETEEDLARLHRTVHWLKSKWLSPRTLRPVSTVVTVADALWRQVIGQSLARADFVIIDCTHPSESILWELRQCVEHCPEATIATVCMDIAEDILDDSARSRDIEIRAAVREVLEHASLAAIVEYGSKPRDDTPSLGKRLKQLIN